MKFTADRATLVRMVRQLSPGKGKEADDSLRLWACAARVFVEANGVTAGTESLVLADGCCFVPRAVFLKLLQSYAGQPNISIEADSQTMRIGTVTLNSVGYTSQVVPPDKFRVFPVTDAWIAKTTQVSVAPKSAGALSSTHVTPVPTPKGTAQPAESRVSIPAAPKVVLKPAPLAWVKNPPPSVTAAIKAIKKQEEADADAARKRAAAESSAASVIRFACNGCKQKFEAEEGMEGRPVKCPSCGQSLTVPTLSKDATRVAQEVLPSSYEVLQRMPAVLEKTAEWLLGWRKGEMNVAQKIVLVIGLTLFIYRGLVPPWVVVYQMPNATVSKAGGYSPILTPPNPAHFWSEYAHMAFVHPDYRLLLMQWTIIAVFTAGGIVVMHRKRIAGHAGTREV